MQQYAMPPDPNQQDQMYVEGQLTGDVKGEEMLGE